MIGLIMTAAVALGAAQESGRDKHPWAKWKSGTSVAYTMTVEAAGMKMEGDLTLTLSQVTEKGYVVKQVSGVGGNNQESTEEEGYPSKDGTETLKADGKEHACAIWKSAGKRGEKSTESRMWLPEGRAVPLKWATKADGQAEADLVATKLSETVEALGKKYDCVRLEGTLSPDGGLSFKSTFWAHADVPGQIVKLVMESADAGLKVTLELSKIEEKK